MDFSHRVRRAFLVTLSFWFLSLPGSLCVFLLLHSRAMNPLFSSALTATSIADYFEHNMWNPLLELLFLEQANGCVAPFLVEIDVSKIALSCHFALDVVCYKGEVPEIQSEAVDTTDHKDTYLYVARLPSLRGYF